MGKGLAAEADLREFVADEQARFFGALLGERTLVPGPDAQLREISFASDSLSSSCEEGTSGYQPRAAIPQGPPPAVCTTPSGAAQRRAEIVPRVDVELGEHLVEVPLDRPWTDEQLGADL